MKPELERAMETEQTEWYIVKRQEGQCHIVPRAELLSERPSRKTSGNPGDGAVEADGALERWGPFESETAAIARRVGLIRAGKCKPA